MRAGCVPDMCPVWGYCNSADSGPLTLRQRYLCHLAGHCESQLNVHGYLYVKHLEVCMCCVAELLDDVDPTLMR